MRLVYAQAFLTMFAEAPPRIQGVFFKQALFLEKNLRYPSLRAKKYDTRKGVWQARVTGSWRFYFTIEGDAYHLLTIIKHPK